MHAFIVKIFSVFSNVTKRFGSFNTLSGSIARGTTSITPYWHGFDISVVLCVLVLIRLFLGFSSVWYGWCVLRIKVWNFPACWGFFLVGGPLIYCF